MYTSSTDLAIIISIQTQLNEGYDAFLSFLLYL